MLVALSTKRFLNSCFEPLLALEKDPTPLFVGQALEIPSRGEAATTCNGVRHHPSMRIDPMLVPHERYPAKTGRAGWKWGWSIASRCTKVIMQASGDGAPGEPGEGLERGSAACFIGPLHIVQESQIMALKGRFRGNDLRSFGLRFV